MKQTLYDYCIENSRQDLLVEWNDEKNAGISRHDVSYGSQRKVWWRCALGHTYSASIVARTYQGIGCSYCSGYKVLPGFNDLKTKCPEVANQWHDKLNGQLTPENVTHGSGKEAWWKCSLGHVWKAKIVSRTCRYSGCPVCAGRKNSPYYDIDYEALEKEILSEQSKD